eukprot:CAMPEP_0118880814 /NCGR_PEP_ID=MMETSP1163-20130328/20354_1 /TAXON_ID=124430 /ORGANISM="Phaeomonas parva, Strain CCMP2877" /LENGTH=200 /DNA_ID=CAMNT_0006817379 /DNA_START=141 /DNA_END=740 /DNA_ORIENTATION=+
MAARPLALTLTLCLSLGFTAAFRSAPLRALTLRRSLARFAGDNEGETPSETRERERREKMVEAVKLERAERAQVFRERRVVDRYVTDGLVRTEFDMEVRDGADVDVYVVSNTDGLDPWNRLAKSRRVLGECHVVVLLPDVFGWESNDMRACADRIAKTCGAIVVMPDLFRGTPWPADAPPGGDGYEAWRATHPEERVAAD